jgi:hypothetical protein
MQLKASPAKWPGKVCKTFMRRFDPDPRLQIFQRLFRMNDLDGNVVRPRSCPIGVTGPKLSSEADKRRTGKNGAYCLRWNRQKIDRHEGGSVKHNSTRNFYWLREIPTAICLKALHPGSIHSVLSSAASTCSNLRIASFLWSAVGWEDPSRCILEPSC